MIMSCRIDTHMDHRAEDNDQHWANPPCKSAATSRLNPERTQKQG